MSEGLGWNAGMLLGTACWKSLRITAVTVTTAATALPTTALANRKGLWIFNPSVNNKTLFLGDSSVGVSTDSELFAAASIPFPVTDQVTLYGRVASGTATILCWEYTVA